MKMDKLLQETGKKIRESEKERALAARAAKAALPAIRFKVVFVDFPKSSPKRYVYATVKPSKVLEWASKQLATIGEQSRVTAYPLS